MRSIAERVAVSGACRLTGRNGFRSSRSGLYRSRVLGGPLRGSFVTMLAADRPSLVMGRYESHVVDAIGDCLPAGGVAYDVGAHIGYLSMVLSKQVGSSGKVFAFEAVPRVRDALRENLSQSGYDNAEIIELALGDTEGPVRFATYEYSTVGHLENEFTASDAQVVEVPGTTLDRFVYRDGNPAPDLLKIDVNGAELAILSGADELLTQRRPHVLVEVRSRTETDVNEYMAAHGYEATCLANDRQAAADLYNVLFRPST